MGEMRKAIAQVALHGAFMTSVIIVWEFARVTVLDLIHRLPLDKVWFSVLVHVIYLVLFLVAWESAKRLLRTRS